MSEIIFENVTKKYENKVVLNDLTIEFPESGFLCITGPSGVGKTTIFNLLLGLTDADSGRVSVSAGCKEECRLSAVFQEDRLLPWSNVLDNILLDAGHLREKAVTILQELGLGDELDSMPSELSGGMARRVAIARALTRDADVYLMDEPTKGLDDDTRREVLNVIHKYTDRAVDADGTSLGRLLIMITHNPDETDGAVLFTL